MPFLSTLPTTLLIVGFVIGGPVLAVAGHILIRRLVPYRDLAKHNDVTGFVLAIVGVVYAVMLAFVVIVAWEDFNRADRTADAEMGALADIYHFSGTYRDPLRAQLRTSIFEYCRLMPAEEWPAMQHGRFSERAEKASMVIQMQAAAMIEGDRHHQSALDDSVMSGVRSFLDSRRDRLSQNDQGIPGALWIAVLLGAVFTVGFTYLFGVENFRLQLVMTGLLAGLISLLIAITIALDYPYRGDTSVSPNEYAELVVRLSAENPSVR